MATKYMPTQTMRTKMVRIGASAGEKFEVVDEASSGGDHPDMRQACFSVGVHAPFLHSPPSLCYLTCPVPARCVSQGFAIGGKSLYTLEKMLERGENIAGFIGTVVVAVAAKQTDDGLILFEMMPSDLPDECAAEFKALIREWAPPSELAWLMSRTEIVVRFKDAINSKRVPLRKYLGEGRLKGGGVAWPLQAVGEENDKTAYLIDELVHGILTGARRAAARRPQRPPSLYPPESPPSLSPPPCVAARPEYFRSPLDDVAGDKGEGTGDEGKDAGEEGEEGDEESHSRQAARHERMRRATSVRERREVQSAGVAGACRGALGGWCLYYALQTNRDRTE